MSWMTPGRDARALARMDALKDAHDVEAFFGQADALLESSAHREIRLLAASSAGVYATTACGMGSLAIRYFEKVVEISNEFAFMEPPFWLTKTGAIENLAILATDFETSERWAERLRQENATAQALSAVGRNEARHDEGLSWPAMQVAIAAGYTTEMNRPGWSAAILEALLASATSRSYRQWRMALPVYLDAMGKVTATVFGDLAKAGGARTKRARDLATFLLGPVRKVTDAYMRAFPLDTNMGASISRFLEGSQELPDKLAEVVDRMRKAQDGYEPPDEGSERPCPALWIQSAPLVREVIRHQLAGSRFRLADVQCAVDRKRAPQPVPCVTLRFESAGDEAASNPNAIDLALRSVVWLSLAYAVNRSGILWAAVPPVTANQCYVRLGQGVPTQIIFIGTDRSQGPRERIWMWCVSDVVDGGWTVEILPQTVRNDQAGMLETVNSLLCEVFRDYRALELELFGSPVVSTCSS